VGLAAIPDPITLDVGLAARSYNKSVITIPKSLGFGCNV